MTMSLPRVLRINAFVSGASGAVCAAAGAPLGRVLDVPSVAVRLTGVGLMGFAAFVGASSGARDAALPRQARLVGVADAVWVIATVVALASGLFSASGSVLVAAVGVVVGAFAYFELRGAGRLTAMTS